MKTDPPVGEDLTVFLTTVKARVLRQATSTRPRRRHIGLATLVIGSVGLLGLGGAAAAAIATNYASTATIREIPRTTNRPADPPPPADYDQTTNNALEPHEASLGQLWAEIDSSLRSPNDGSADFASWTPGGMADFATAITDRCYPLRTAEDVTELEQLRTTYEAQGGVAGHALAVSYFERATALCM
jgi:hypothetical protein